MGQSRKKLPLTKCISTFKKPWAIALFLFLLPIVVGLGLWTIHIGYTEISPQELSTFIQRHECCKEGIFIALHIVATVLGIPGTVMTVTGGALFGLMWGTIWSVLGATLGAIAAFWITRSMLGYWVAQRFHHHPTLKRLLRAVGQNPWQCVFLVRFAPISPFTVVNFLFGLTPIPFKPYAVGTFLGIIPGTMAYTWVGVTGVEAFSGGDRLPLFLALGLLTVLSVLPWWVHRGRSR